ncbi:Rieske (2Fe-2S) protein [Streptoalloteichus hindustanus]|uniref:Cytochrome bc1 complex Rieske iron-sulfur subunit n=1 Tax=Streptoalloteichus hindustanus TaxID=2017 RepID=A0A1M4Y040_STRHI|nr:Rieske (2Fe-2S) protein [Streptoalloteichus hindustanus]SHE98852.1 Ferredoxin subunit of nitrite reductase or a ring-hydroxylating dioxygenase [Streptoalloteichus hindustanus]
MDEVRPRRRQVLHGLAVTLSAPGWGGCDTGTEPPVPPVSPPRREPTSSSAPSSPAGPPPVAAVADIPLGGGRVVDRPDGRKLLLVRPAEADVRGFDPTCPHQGCTVPPPVDGVITCPCHASQFDGPTGALRRGPATRGLTAVPVKVEGEHVVLA